VTEASRSCACCGAESPRAVRLISTAGDRLHLHWTAELCVTCLQGLAMDLEAAFRTRVARRIT
jgi:hypothetical protein